MTTAFYAPPDAFKGTRVLLPDDEARHASKVLRKEPGDDIVVVDGTGGWHRVRLDHVGKRQVLGHVVDTVQDRGELPVRVTIGMGLIKNRNRFETFVEKAVELGVQCIQPLQTHRTEVESLRETRTQNLMIAALKQSGRSRLPDLAETASLPDVLVDAPEASFLAHEAVGATASLDDALRAAFNGVVPEERPEEVLVLVGPEGGFTDVEVAAARDAGVAPVSMGARRLRAETAGIVAATSVMMVVEALT